MTESEWLASDDGTLDPHRLAVLSDALEEAGCDDETILQHLRGYEEYRECDKCRVKPGMPRLCKTCLRNRAAKRNPLPTPHYRGCFALDLILGEE